MTTTSPHANSAASGGLAAAICMAASQLVFLLTGLAPAAALAYGLSLASIAFGGTYAGVFFVRRARRDRSTRPAVSPS